MYRLFLARRWLASRPIGKVTLVGIWLSVMATIATVSVMTGFLREHERKARNTTSDIVITPRPRRAPDGSIEKAADSARIREVLAGVAGIEQLAPRLLRPALVRIDGVSPSVLLGDRKYSDRNFVRVIGVDAEADGAAFRRHLEIDVSSEFDGALLGAEVDHADRPFSIDSRHLDSKYKFARLPVVLIGAELFRYFGLKKGERINLVTIPEHAEKEGEAVKPLSELFVIGGAVQTGDPDYDGRTVYIEHARAMSFTRAASDATEIGVTLASGLDVDVVELEIARALEAAGIKARVETWRDKSAVLLDAVEMERALMMILLFFFIVVACFNIFMTLTILVVDKTRDIGVLNALGAPRSGILQIVVGNGFLMALLAGTVGAVSGVLLTQHLNEINEYCGRHFGIMLLPGKIFAFHGVPIELSPSFVAVTVLVTLLISFVFAWLPARRAAAVDPVEALRHD